MPKAAPVFCPYCPHRFSRRRVPPAVPAWPSPVNAYDKTCASRYHSLPYRESPALGRVKQGQVPEQIRSFHSKAWFLIIYPVAFAGFGIFSINYDYFICDYFIFCRSWFYPGELKIKTKNEIFNNQYQFGYFYILVILFYSLYRFGYFLFFIIFYYIHFIKLY